MHGPALMTIRTAASFALLIVTTGATCNTVSLETYRDAERKLLECQKRENRLETQLAAEQQTVRDLTSQLANLRNVEGDPADVLIMPERIALNKLSGGHNEDGKVGDEGLLLYVEPYDRDNHVVKSAGTIHVRLLDPRNPAEQVVLGEYDFDAKTVRTLWYGRLWTHYYRVWCPWPDGKIPEHNEVTAFVVFTELITGRSLTAAGTYKVEYPAEIPQ